MPLSRARAIRRPPVRLPISAANGRIADPAPSAILGRRPRFRRSIGLQARFSGPYRDIVERACQSGPTEPAIGRLEPTRCLGPLLRRFCRHVSRRRCGVWRRLDCRIEPLDRLSQHVGSARHRGRGVDFTTCDAGAHDMDRNSGPDALAVPTVEIGFLQRQCAASRSALLVTTMGPVSQSCRRCAYVDCSPGNPLLRAIMDPHPAVALPVLELRQLQGRHGRRPLPAGPVVARRREE